MKLIIIRVLLFCLVPLGAFILYKGIRLLRRTFSGKVILEIPFSQKTGFFEITEPGVYTIWQKGEYLKKMPLDKFKPVIYDISSNKKIKIIPSIFRPNSNDGKTIKMEIFHFRLNPGKYSIELAEGKSISSLELIISSIVPAGRADLTKHPQDITVFSIEAQSMQHAASV